jgi:hypothetical protein
VQSWFARHFVNPPVAATSGCEDDGTWAPGTWVPEECWLNIGIRWTFDAIDPTVAIRGDGAGTGTVDAELGDEFEPETAGDAALSG